MLNGQITKTVFLAQKGDPYARTVLLLRNRSFVRKAASGICNRNLYWDKDRELEIAMNAFDEAIDIFPNNRDESFLVFAQKVIFLRIQEHFEREENLDSIKASGEIDEDVAMMLKKRNDEDRERKIAGLWEKHKEILEEYGVSYNDLMGNQSTQPGLGNKLINMLHTARGALRKYWNEIKEAGA